MKKKDIRSDALLMVPVAGVEPARPRGHKILSLARLPIPSRRLIDSQHRNFIKYRDDIQVIFC